MPGMRKQRNGENAVLFRFQRNRGAWRRMLMLVMQRWILLVMRRRMPLNRDWEKTRVFHPLFSSERRSCPALSQRLRKPGVNRAFFTYREMHRDPGKYHRVKQPIHLDLLAHAEEVFYAFRCEPNSFYRANAQNVHILQVKIHRKFTRFG